MPKKNNVQDKTIWQQPADLFSEYQHAPRAITAMSLDSPKGGYIAPHRHPRHQLLYASTGLMRAATENGLWFIPPQRALWIPAGIVHDQTMLSPVTMRTLYFETSMTLSMGDKCRVIEVPRLLRELITALAAEPLEYEVQGRNGFLIGLLLAELERSATVALELPWPKDKRIVAVCQAILANPGGAQTIQHWSGVAGASQRTLIRLFQKETGLSYRQWVQQARLATALSRLENRVPVAALARDLGYSSASAFTAMFKRVLGETPSDYLARTQD